ncbi:hypothetical protein [Arthrobacter sp. TMS1-12-1]
MSNQDDSQGWPFSDEAAARDAGIIPPDPSTPGDLGAEPPEEFVAAITDTVDADAFNGSEKPDHGSSEDAESRDQTVTPDADHPVNSDDYPSQPEAARASEHPDRTGYQNDADPPR